MSGGFLWGYLTLVSGVCVCVYLTCVFVCFISPHWKTSHCVPFSWWGHGCHWLPAWSTNRERATMASVRVFLYNRSAAQPITFKPVPSSVGRYRSIGRWTAPSVWVLCCSRCRGWGTTDLPYNICSNNRELLHTRIVKRNPCPENQLCKKNSGHMMSIVKLDFFHRIRDDLFPTRVWTVLTYIRKCASVPL